MQVDDVPTSDDVINSGVQYLISNKQREDIYSQSPIFSRSATGKISRCPTSKVHPECTHEETFEARGPSDV